MQAFGASSARERVRVIAVSRDEVIVRTRGGNGADHDSFLSDVKVTKAADLLRLILLAGAFFKAPDQQHQREHARPRRAAPRAASSLRGPGQCRFPRCRFRIATEGKAEDENEGEERGRSRANFGKTSSAGVALYCGSPIVRACHRSRGCFRITRIAQPGKDIGDHDKRTPMRRSKPEASSSTNAVSATADRQEPMMNRARYRQTT